MSQVCINGNNTQNNDNVNIDETETYQISDDELDDLDDECLLEEAEVPGGAAIGRGPYERAWTTEATRALIHIRGPMEGSFTEGRQKRTALWLHCTRQLQRLGFRYSAAKVQKKWHNILITYNKNLSKKYVSGYVHWEFFEEMFKYLQGKKADFEMQLQPIQQQQQQQQQQQSQLQLQQQHQVVSAQEPQVQSQPEICLTAPYPKKPSTPQQPTIKLQPPMTPPLVKESHPYVTPIDQILLQPQGQIESKSNDEFDEDSNSTTEVRQPKIEFDADPVVNIVPDPTQFSQLASTIKPPIEQTDDIWWKDYFERKLEVEREKMVLQRSLQREQVQIQKMSLVQQERIERMKIDAINSLTATLQKLVEAKCRRA